MDLDGLLHLAPALPHVALAVVGLPVLAAHRPHHRLAAGRAPARRDAVPVNVTVLPRPALKVLARVGTLSQHAKCYNTARDSSQDRLVHIDMLTRHMASIKGIQV